MVREHRVPGVAMLAMALVAAMLALASVGRLDGSGLLYIVNRPPPQRPPRVLSRPGGYPLQDIIVEEEVGVVAPDPKFIPTMSTTIQCLNGQNFDNARLVVTDTCMFNTGDLNVTNSTIIFTNLVQFFSTKQTIILSSDSKWTFTNTTTVMVVTTWSGTGTFEFSESSNLTIATSNTLTIECQSVFKGSITIGNTRTKLLLNGPSINTGTIYLVDRTSEYVCATTPSLGRCVLDSVNVVSQATDLTGWRIAQQLECRGGTMVVNNCTIGSQTTLPFELILLSTPRWSVLNLNNITRASLFCGTKFGSTAFSDTTAFLVDTTCTYWGNTSWSNVADPFQPSDGFVIDYGTLVFANVTQTSKGLYITNGNFHIDGTSFYVDVKATDRGSWSLPLLEYNMTQCKTDWDDFITIQNCPTYSDCRWSAATLPNGRCVVYFHYNDWFDWRVRCIADDRTTIGSLASEGPQSRKQRQPVVAAVLGPGPVPMPVLGVLLLGPQVQAQAGDEAARGAGPRRGAGVRPRGPRRPGSHGPAGAAPDQRLAAALRRPPPHDLHRPVPRVPRHADLPGRRDGQLRGTAGPAGGLRVHAAAAASAAEGRQRQGIGRAEWARGTVPVTDRSTHIPVHRRRVTVGLPPLWLQ
eukprot:EG_transcript_4085